MSEFFWGVLISGLWIAVALVARLENGRLRARAEAAEKRVAELELHEQSVDEELFRVLWEDYGSAPDDTLAPSGLRLKQKLRGWVGIDAAEGGAEWLAAILRHERDGCLARQRELRTDDSLTCEECVPDCLIVTALRSHEARKEGT